jgi:hypothetical protein
MPRMSQAMLCIEKAREGLLYLFYQEIPLTISMTENRFSAYNEETVDFVMLKQKCKVCR